MKPLFLFCALTLTGCTAGLNSDFSCSGIDGINGCVSLNDINTMVDKGQFATDNQGNVLRQSPATPVTLPDSTTTFSTVNPPLVTGKPTRKREEVRQITVFPYIDSQGNYHDTSIIYTVITAPSWMVTPSQPATLPPRLYPKGAL
ncbi:type IV conjugative transfer system lipoprotein TraV [Photobacterium leiognathi]|uniref:Type IV conjugative transfer system protein TraV n=1 Tax=Photobacterium leiognathi TaxID=553611 RepID=A0A2T3M7H2_PHOLE|nr:type IV conjugative transfer system lipoprotein TraV [Photobacterium leiognathi]KJF97431.1 hypothetical protein UB34_13005 [Photobacterium leiognathi]PSV88234.1 type IV conjugative transfer system protein TraV [Photobacterium leiognathi]